MYDLDFYTAKITSATKEELEDFALAVFKELYVEEGEKAHLVERIASMMVGNLTGEVTLHPLGESNKKLIKCLVTCLSVGIPRLVQVIVECLEEDEQAGIHYVAARRAAREQGYYKPEYVYCYGEYYTHLFDGVNWSGIKPTQVEAHDR